jgi:GLPGLI family protein
MKKTILTIIGTLAMMPVFAQTTTGKVSYKETIKLDINIDKEMEQFAAMLPKEQTFKKVLYFTPDASLYENDKAATQPQSDFSHAEGRAEVQIKIHRPEEKTYCDLKEKKKLEQKEFMSRKFLINSDMGDVQWKLTGKQKTILNYPCQEAIAKKDTNEVQAWFTSAIPVGAGPSGYGNLPGLILEMNVGKNITVAAINVDAGAVDKSVIVKPKEGKKVSEKEFRGIVAEKQKEMQEQFGGSGNRVIIREER